MSTGDRTVLDSSALDAGTDAGTDTGGATDAGTPVDGGGRACAPPADPKKPHATLADTGCMDPSDLTRFMPSAIRYEVNSPLWSDAADKERAFVLPPGGKIHVLDCKNEPDVCLGAADDGRWIFPVGTIALKNFYFDGKVVETRLLDAIPNGTWVGYSYQWNEAQTAATLVVAEGATISFNTGSRTVEWTYPSRRDCTQCHTRANWWTIGPETAQMNRVPTTPGLGTQNQIDRMAAAGVFETPPTKPYKAALATPYSGSFGQATPSANVTEKARSYLHANCGFCHRPDGELKNLDLRYDTPFKDTGLCNASPVKGTLGVADATNLTPGKPDLSLVWLRMNALGMGRMPTIGSAVLDKDALTLVGDWVKSIKSCP